MANFVPGVGNREAKLMIIGMAPGSVEDKVGEPFYGPAGERLDDWLEFAGIDRHDCWITNVVKYYPPNDDLRRLPEIGVDIKEQIAILWKEIDQIRPNCILGLGGFALEVLTGKRGITKYRGSILTTIGKRYKVVCTYHPAHFLHQKGGEVRDASAEVYAKLDVEKALQESKTNQLILPKRNLWISKNSGKLWEYLSRNKNETTLSVDIETPKFYGCLPICIGLSFKADEGVSIPLIPLTQLGANWSQSDADLAESWRLVAKKLADPKVKVIGQNFKFDEGKLRRIGFYVANFFMDVGTAFKIVYPELPGNIGFIASIETREPYWKDEGKEWNPKKEGVEGHLIYNARDAAVTRECADAVIQELIECGMYDFYFNPEYGYHLAHYLYMEMEDIGFRVDFQVRLALAKKYSTIIKQLQTRLDTFAGRHVKVFENRKDMPSLLYNELKLPKRGAWDKKAQEFKVKCDEETITALLNNHAKDPRTRQILNDALDLRKNKKTLSTYVLAKPDYDNRMRTVVNVNGTETGRTSNKQLKPPVRPDKIGLAFQTMTKHGDIGADIRTMFIPDDGYVFLNFDLRTAEPRIVALLSEDYDTLALYDTIDVHALTASWAFGGTWEKWSKAAHDGEECPERFVGKTTRNAGNYDMHKRRAMMTINTDAKKYGIDLEVSEWKAGQFLEIFHRHNPKIRSTFQQQIKDAINTDRVLINPYGRRREFLGRWSEDLYREAYAQIPQSTVRDTVYRAMLRIKRREPKIQFLLEAHDAFLAQVPIPKADATYYICKEEMEKPIPFDKCTLPRKELTIPCDCEIGKVNYKDLRKYRPVEKQAA